MSEARTLSFPVGGGSGAEGRPASALEIRGGDKRYGGVHALKDVSLRVGAGEVLALVGENGAGKSTLVGVAAGRVSPDSGEVCVNGARVLARGPAAAMEAGIRLVPQELLLCPDMSVLDNILLGQRPRTVKLFLDKRKARAEGRRRLARLGVTIDFDVPVGLLTVVEKTFVQIARSLTPGAVVMLIDEPTAPMDATEVDSFLSVLGALTADGIGIVYISHRLDEIFRLANRVCVMRDGAIVAEFSRGEMNHTTVVDAMVGGRTLRDPVATGATGSSNVAMRVGSLRATGLNEVSFDLHAGELLAVYGISGSGRESLGAVLVGATTRQGGSVVVGGATLRPGSVAAAVAKGVGYVPAERRTQGLDLDASVAANLTWAILRRLGRWGFVRGRTVSATADTWISRLKVKTQSSSASVGSLSGGSQQKVLLARWLAAGSQTLILEEPTRGVDVGTKAEIYHLLREMAESGAAVLVITSDIEEASIVAPRVLVMRNGTVAAELHHPTQSELARAAQTSKDSEHV